MKTSKEKGYPNNLSIFEKIFNILAHNLESASEIYEKITEFIADDFKQTPQKEVDLNLDTLAEQTKYASGVKYLLNNKEKYGNPLYSAKNCQKILKPNFAYYSYKLWTAYFMRNSEYAE